MLHSVQFISDIALMFYTVSSYKKMHSAKQLTTSGQEMYIRLVWNWPNQPAILLIVNWKYR